MNSKSNIGWDVIYLTGSKVLISVIGLATSMLLARFRTLEEYGTYSQILMVTDLASTILLLGIPNSINYFLSRANSPKEQQRFLSVYVTLSTILTMAIGASLLLSVSLIIDYFENPFIKSFAYVFAVYPWSTLMINSIGNACVIYGKTKKLVVYNICNTLVTLLLLLLAKYASWSFQQYMIAYMSALFCFAVFGLGWMRKMAGAIYIYLKWDTIKEIFAFSIPMGLAATVGTLNAELDKLVIGRFFNTDEYAIFANAAKEMPVSMLTVSVTAVLLPQMVRLLKNQETFRAIQLWKNAIELCFTFICLLVGGFIVFAPDLLSLFYSEKYVTSGSVTVFRLYSCVLLFRAVYWGIVLNASGKTRFILYSSLLTLLFNFICNFLFYYILGFVGPAVATLCVTAVMAIVQLKFTSIVLRLPVKDIFPWKPVTKLLIKSMCVALLFWIIKYVLISEHERVTSIIHSMCLGGVWSLVFVWMNVKPIINNWQNLNRI